MTDIHMYADGIAFKWYVHMHACSVYHFVSHLLIMNANTSYDMSLYIVLNYDNIFLIVSVRTKCFILFCAAYY